MVCWKNMSSGDNASTGNQNHQPPSKSYLDRQGLRAEVEDVKNNENTGTPYILWESKG